MMDLLEIAEQDEQEYIEQESDAIKDKIYNVFGVYPQEAEPQVESPSSSNTGVVVLPVGDFKFYLNKESHGHTKILCAFRADRELSYANVRLIGYARDLLKLKNT